ncbi:hypothetical protein SY27_07625 [Flavobacterium sp. 316]|uniref:Uncharacterized protein n=1 Tax=Flavobacterium sediminilitoris TaxID=2024526 RepID=A0ABY4HRP0_9FLAO|nr:MULTISPECIES: hypothetical protein [Flavobacterium]KIX21560.1 hypothetical protein SY27_07625 [Flavobacterium sp. 316]UOX35535.1 hypothetical protein LXD69_08425 [Flavobacterium sediminilitoris]
MKKVTLFLFLFIGFYTNAQLVFENNKTNSNTPKFIVNTSNSTTQFYTKVGGIPKLYYTWNKVPQLFDDADRTNRYKMTVVENDKIAKRTFEIYYSLYRETQGYIGYIKQTIDFHDSRPTKIIEDNFKLKN